MVKGKTAKLLRKIKLFTSFKRSSQHGTETHQMRNTIMWPAIDPAILKRSITTGTNDELETIWLQCRLQEPKWRRNNKAKGDITSAVQATHYFQYSSSSSSFLLDCRLTMTLSHNVSTSFHLSSCVSVPRSLTASLTIIRRFIAQWCSAWLQVVLAT